MTRSKPKKPSKGRPLETRNVAFDEDSPKEGERNLPRDPGAAVLAKGTQPARSKRKIFKDPPSED